MKRDVKHLILMRHAEADWGLNDFDRPLTKRGHQQAAQAGAWLAERGYIPEQIMASAGRAGGERPYGAPGRGAV